jgi:hypothetical protein
VMLYRKEENIPDLLAALANCPAGSKDSKSCWWLVDGSPDRSAAARQSRGGVVQPEGERNAQQCRSAASQGPLPSAGV